MSPSEKSVGSFRSSFVSGFRILCLVGAAALLPGPVFAADEKPTGLDTVVQSLIFSDTPLAEFVAVFSRVGGVSISIRHRLAVRQSAPLLPTRA